MVGAFVHRCDDVYLGSVATASYWRVDRPVEGPSQWRLFSLFESIKDMIVSVR